MSELLQVSDAFLAPSILEGFSNVALEAMSSGLPILARDGVSGYGKLIKDKKTGIYFRDDLDLAGGILELYNNPLLRKNIGAAARNHIVQNYSVEAMIEKYRQLYKDLMQSNQKQ